MSEDDGYESGVRIDPHSGRPTTGHRWDGIEELNTPLPRWWVWTFWATIVWGLAYTVVYPAWPTASGGTEGLFGWHSRDQVAKDLADLQATRGDILARLKDAPLAGIESNPQLLSAARTVGKVAFVNNCSGCHGAGGQGAKGYPNLNDDDWVWGGSLADIRQTIESGVRWDADKATRSGAMPAFGRDGVLSSEQVAAVAEYVRSLAELPDTGPPEALGTKIYEDNCAACHGVNGEGNPAAGAPNLADAIWLGGSDTASIIARVQNGGGGVMPAWKDRLDETTIKALTVYVHSMGGGK